MNSVWLHVDPALEIANRLRMRRVEHVEVLAARTSAAAPRGRATTHPCPSSTNDSKIPTASSANSSSRLTSSRSRCGSSSQPSQSASSAPVQSVASRAQMRSTISLLMQPPASALGLDALDDLLERVRELLDAFRLERLDDVVVVDTHVAKLPDQRARLVEAFEHRVAAHLAVILERLDRLERHRVHGVGPDQLLDVDHVAVGRVLRRRRRPQAALLRRALPLEVLPARAGERLEEVLVRELRVRDRELTLQRRVARQPPGACPPRCRPARRRTRRPSEPSTDRRRPRPAARARADTPGRPPCSDRARRSA